jgi:hypothetical protein
MHPLAFVTYRPPATTNRLLAEPGGGPWVNWAWVEVSCGRFVDGCIVRSKHVAGGPLSSLDRSVVRTISMHDLHRHVYIRYFLLSNCPREKQVEISSSSHAIFDSFPRSFFLVTVSSMDAKIMDIFLYTLDASWSQSADWDLRLVIYYFPSM